MGGITFLRLVLSGPGAHKKPQRLDRASAARSEVRRHGALAPNGFKAVPGEQPIGTPEPPNTRLPPTPNTNLF